MVKMLTNLSVGISFEYSQIFCGYLDVGGEYKVPNAIVCFCSIVPVLLIYNENYSSFHKIDLPDYFLCK